MINRVLNKYLVFMEKHRVRFVGKFNEKKMLD